MLMNAQKRAHSYSWHFANGRERVLSCSWESAHDSVVCKWHLQMVFKLAKNKIHVFRCFLSFQKNQIHAFWGFLSLQKWNSCFLRFLSLQKMKFMFFEFFLSLQKMKFMFFEVFKIAINHIHIFWGFLCLQKTKFMSFEFF